jgi:hypothetical protein
MYMNNSPSAGITRAGASRRSGRIFRKSLHTAGAATHSSVFFAQLGDRQGIAALLSNTVTIA